MIIEIFMVCVATAAIGVLFNIRGWKLVFGAFAGGLAWLVYLLCSKVILSVTTVFFIASVVVAVYSEVFARIAKTPVTTFIICGIIPLVPGGGMFKTILEILRGNLKASLINGIETLSIAGAIAVGISFVSIISKLKYLKRT